MFKLLFTAAFIASVVYFYEVYVLVLAFIYSLTL